MIYVDPGTELWLPWAKRRAARLAAWASYLGTPVLHKILTPASGVTVDIKAGPALVAPKIRITGGSGALEAYGVGYGGGSSGGGSPPSGEGGQVFMQDVQGMNTAGGYLSQYSATPPGKVKLATQFSKYDKTKRNSVFAGGASIAGRNFPFTIDKKAMPTTYAAKLTLVRATWNAGYKDEALALYKSLVLAFRYGVNSTVSVSATRAASLSSFYASSVIVDAMQASNMFVLADGTILLTVQSEIYTNGISALPSNTGGSTKAVPAPTVGVGGSEAADTAAYTFVTGLDIAARSVWPFAIAILAVHPTNEGTFSSATLADARQVFSAVVDPLRVGLPRVTAGGIAKYGKGGHVDSAGTTYFVSADCYPVAGGHAAYVVHSQMTSSASPTYQAQAAGVVRPTDATTLALQDSKSPVNFLTFNFAGSYSSIVASAIRLRGKSDALNITLTPAGTTSPNPNPPDNWTLSYPGGVADLTQSTGMLVGACPAADGHLALDVRFDGTNFNSTLYADSASVHTATHVKAAPASGSTLVPRQWQPPAWAPGAYMQQSNEEGSDTRYDRMPPLFESRYFDGATHHYVEWGWQDFAWNYGDGRNTYFPNTRHYYLLTALGPTPYYVAIYTPWFPAFAWSCRLADLPAYAKLPQPLPGTFDALFGVPSAGADGPPIYSPQVSPPSLPAGETDLEVTAASSLSTSWTSLQSSYTAMLALPAAQQPDAWDSLRASAAALFGSYHTVAWTNAPAGTDMTALAQALSGMGMYAYGKDLPLDFRGSLVLSRKDPRFAPAYS